MSIRRSNGDEGLGHFVEILVVREDSEKSLQYQVDLRGQDRRGSEDVEGGQGAPYLENNLRDLRRTEGGVIIVGSDRHLV